jgi:hypothetical protein
MYFLVAFLVISNLFIFVSSTTLLSEDLKKLGIPENAESMKY